MTAQHIHKARIREHLQIIKDAIAVGIDSRPATIGFHTSACAIDLVELYLHKTGKIPIGLQVKHDWFKRPTPGQKIMPLAERHLQADFPHKKEIIDLLYTLEEKRNKLIYGHSTPAEIQQAQQAFEKLKQIMQSLLRETGEEIESSDR
ncbi:hypothetical protein HYU22_00730 [Candidatus Woesearchaeota archaeon]|nr:hypothetical protein [Candidatus Woesearchaeota archaeon]